MKQFLIFIFCASFAVARGGDTLAFSPQFQSFTDGDTIFAETHFHSPHDSTQSIINGRLGNINLAADADIDPNKIDSSKTADKMRAAYMIVADSLNVTGPISGTSVSATTISSTRDSTGILVVKDTAKINILSADTTTSNRYFGGVMALTGAMQASKYYSAVGTNNVMIVNYSDKGLQVHATTGKVLADTMATLKDSTGILVAKDSVKANKITAVWCSVGTNVVVKDSVKTNRAVATWCSVGTNIVVKDTAKIKIAKVDSLHIANGGKVEVGKRLYFGDSYLTEDGDVFGFSKGVSQPIQFDIANTTGNGLAIFGGKVTADSLVVGTDTFALADGYVDYSATTTLTGFSSTTAKEVYYKRLGSLLFVRYFIQGTSNATTFKFTLPYETQVIKIGSVFIIDNGTDYRTGGISSTGSNNTISVERDEFTSVPWVASGTKASMNTFIAIIK
jgi:hypothetical protein